MDLGANHPFSLLVAALVGGVATWLKFRLKRWDQQANRITELEAQVAKLQIKLEALVDLKVENALLQSEKARLVEENDGLRAAAHLRRKDDVAE